MASVPGHISRKGIQTLAPSFARPSDATARAHLLSASLIDSNDLNHFCHAAASFEAGRRRSLGVVGKAVALLFFNLARGRGLASNWRPPHSALPQLELMTCRRRARMQDRRKR